jgi:CDP-diacylglycerol---glycerol-3-phosphate 3-phosphatidyltransferase
MSGLGLQEKALVGFLLALPVGVLSAYGVRVLALGRATDPRVAQVPGSVFVGRFTMEAFYWALSRTGRAVAASGISPDALTLLSLVVSLLSLPLAALGYLSWAGIALLTGAALDCFDGIVARERGIASDSGEVLDAVVDRYADAAPLVGLAVYYRASPVALLVVLGALVGTELVSYVRAKSEAMGLSLPAGLMRRHERITYLTLGLVLGPLVAVGRMHIERPLTLLSVAVVGAVSHVAAITLTRRARAALAERERVRGASE